MKAVFSLVLATLLAAPLAFAQNPELTRLDVVNQWTADATGHYYNYALRLKWANRQGDFLDAQGTPQGSVPFFTFRTSVQTGGFLDLDVTSYVRAYGGNLMIRGAGAYSFHSKETTTGEPPKLIVDGVEVPVLADLTLPTSFTATGTSPTLSGNVPILLKFAQGPNPNIGSARLSPHPHIGSARLRLHVFRRYSSSPLIQIFRPYPHAQLPVPPVLAEGTQADIVLLLQGEDFFTQHVRSEGPIPADRSRINADGTVTIWVPQGRDLASPAMYRIPPERRSEVMFARITMKLHEDWTPRTGGKLPGITNTGKADARPLKSGWGCRPVTDGTNWSARTNRYGYSPTNPYADTYMGFSAYAYRINRTSDCGEGSSSEIPLPIGRWFVLDQMVALNTVNADGTSNADGEVSYWLNGVCVSRMTGVRWRANNSPASLPSEYWLNFYVGGTGYIAPYQHTVSFEKVLVSSRLMPFDPSVIRRLNGY